MEPAKTGRAPLLMAGALPIERLNQDTQGRQPLMMFRMNRLVPYRKEYMISMEEFLGEHKKLKFRTGKEVQ